MDFDEMLYLDDLTELDKKHEGKIKQAVSELNKYSNPRAQEENVFKQLDLKVTARELENIRESYKYR